MSAVDGTAARATIWDMGGGGSVSVGSLPNSRSERRVAVRSCPWSALLLIAPARLGTSTPTLFAHEMLPSNLLSVSSAHARDCSRSLLTQGAQLPVSRL